MDSILVVGGGILFFIGVMTLIIALPTQRERTQFFGGALVALAFILWSTAAATNGTVMKDLCQEKKIEDCRGYE